MNREGSAVSSTRQQEKVNSQAFTKKIFVAEIFFTTTTPLNSILKRRSSGTEVSDRRQFFFWKFLQKNGPFSGEK